MTAQEQSNGWRTFWDRGRWWKALIVTLGYLALYELSSLALGALFGGAFDDGGLLASPKNVLLGLALPLAVGAIVLVAFVASVRWLRALFAPQPIAGRWWMWIFVVLVIIPIILRFIGIDYASIGAGVVVATLLSGLLIGFTEELLYRGIVVKILRDGGHREWTVAIISSALFALSHSVNLLSGQPILTVALTVAFTFGFGMMMYLVLRATGSIIWPMILHSLTDPTTFLAAGGIDTGDVAGTNSFLALAAPFNIVFIVAALIALLFIRGRVAAPQALAQPGFERAAGV